MADVDVIAKFAECADKKYGHEWACDGTPWQQCGVLFHSGFSLLFLLTIERVSSIVYVISKVTVFSAHLGKNTVISLVIYDTISTCLTCLLP